MSNYVDFAFNEEELGVRPPPQDLRNALTSAAPTLETLVLSGPLGILDQIRSSFAAVCAFPDLKRDFSKLMGREFLMALLTIGEEGGGGEGGDIAATHFLPILMNLGELTIGIYSDQDGYEEKRKFNPAASILVSAIGTNSLYCGASIARRLNGVGKTLGGPWAMLMERDAYEEVTSEDPHWGIEALGCTASLLRKAVYTTADLDPKASEAASRFIDI